METVKTIGVLIVLLVVGYFGYKAVTTPPPTPPRDQEPAVAGGTPQVNVPIPEIPSELAQQPGRAGGNTATSSTLPTAGTRVPATEINPPAAFMAGSAVMSPSAPGSDSSAAARSSSQPLDSLTPQPAIADVSGLASRPGGGIATTPRDGIQSPGVIPDQNAGGLQETANPPPASGIRKEFADFIEAACRKLDQGDFVQVHTVLSAWYADPRLTQEEDAQLTDLLDQVAGSVIFSRQHILERPYVVQPGDTLPQIADRYNVTPELLAKINGLNQAEPLVPGTTLKVIRGPFEANVNLHRRELVLMLQGKYAGRFRIGIGADARQCEGVYQVREKTVAPRYFSDTGVIEPGDPRNPLGPKWIGLEGRLGIHGTSNPQNFDDPQAPGAIFVSAADMDDLFDILTIGSRVTITR